MKALLKSYDNNRSLYISLKDHNISKTCPRSVDTTKPCRVTPVRHHAKFTPPHSTHIPTSAQSIQDNAEQ